MVYGVIMNFVQSAKYRGGWRGLLEHMYTVRDVPLVSTNLSVLCCLLYTRKVAARLMLCIIICWRASDCAATEF